MVISYGKMKRELLSIRFRAKLMLHLPWHKESTDLLGSY